MNPKSVGPGASFDVVCSRVVNGDGAGKSAGPGDVCAAEEPAVDMVLVTANDVLGKLLPPLELDRHVVTTGKVVLVK